MVNVRKNQNFELRISNCELAGEEGRACESISIRDDALRELTATPACVGDCDAGGTVTVDGLLAMVNIALGNAQRAECIAGDADRNGAITIDEILAAVNNALNGCVQKP